MLTKVPITRPSPMASAMTGAFVPFCTEMAYPSGVSRGADHSAAVRVCWDFVVMTTRSIGGRSAG
jgi:hypothetical protein